MTDYKNIFQLRQEKKLERTKPKRYDDQSNGLMYI